MNVMSVELLSKRMMKKYTGDDLTLKNAEKYLVFLLNARKMQNGDKNVVSNTGLKSHDIPKSALQMAMDDAMVNKAIEIFERSGLKVEPYGKKLRASRGIKKEIERLIEQGITDTADIRRALERKNYITSSGSELSDSIRKAFENLGRKRPTNKKLVAHASINNFVESMVKQGMTNAEIYSECKSNFPELEKEVSLRTKIERARKKLGIFTTKRAA